MLLILAQTMPTAFVYKQQQNKVVDAWMLEMRAAVWFGSSRDAGDG